MTRMELEPTRLGAFNSARLVRELLYADLMLTYARSIPSEEWAEEDRKWRKYRNLLLDWRYMLQRGTAVYRLCGCPLCPRIVQAEFNLRAHCFDCGASWIFRE